MLVRLVCFGCAIAVCGLSSSASAQRALGLVPLSPRQPSTATTTAPQWRAPGGNSAAGTANTSTATATPLRTATTAPIAPAGASPATLPAAATSAAPLAAMQPATRTPIAKVTAGSGALPNDKGQVWREYDISPYTLRVTSTNRPEQAIIDWILRETGYEAWHSEPLGLLSADKRTLRVYHTPQMQNVVSEIVDRFVSSEAESHTFGMRIISMSNPSWRAKAQRILKPTPVQSQGVQAWLLAKEDAALMIGELRKRSDFRENNSPHLMVNNGQVTIISATRPKNYIRGVNLRGDTWPGFEPQMGQIDEGYSLEFNPLLSLDGRSIDAVLKCNIDQVEKLVPVQLDVPTALAPRQRTQIDVPQLSSSRLHERFHWPVDQVLLISAGMVATPTPTPSGTTGLSLPGVTTPSRADVLLFIESKGKTTGQAPAPEAAAAPITTGALPARPAYRGQTYRGRY